MKDLIRSYFVFMSHGEQFPWDYDDTVTLGGVFLGILFVVPVAIFLVIYKIFTCRVL